MNEIYHDESLGVHINVVLVRMIMLGYAKVKYLKICDLWMLRTGLADGISVTLANVALMCHADLAL